MSRISKRLFPWLVAIAAPMVIYANSGANAAVPAPPMKRTGAQVDGGLACTACHATNPVNSGGGRVFISTAAYRPGIRQDVTLTVEDPNALRRGFQITARLKSNESKTAGFFSTSPEVQVRCDDGTVRGRPGPCSGQLEFASHTAAGTRAGTAGTQTYTLSWTPPGRDMGPVVFFFAGNAANNNGANTGDQIYTGSQEIASAGCNLTGTPSINANGVSDAASFRTALSPNAMMSVFGSTLLPAGTAYSATRLDLVPSSGDPNVGVVPPDLACLAVEVNGKRGVVYFANENQINAQAPIDFSAGNVNVVLIANPETANEKRSAVRQVMMQSYTPSFYTFPGNSVAALNASDGYKFVADPAQVPGAVPAKPGDVVVFYGTGFGLTNPVYQTGEFSSGPATITGQYSIMLGGTTLSNTQDVFYAGLSPDAPGFFQFNVRIPASTPDGNIPVKVQMGSFETQNGITIPVKR